MSSEHSWNLVARNNIQRHAVEKNWTIKNRCRDKAKKIWLDRTHSTKSQNEICHSALEWNPQGRRSRGRPKATWRRTVLANYELKLETAIDGS
jgi:hypothetical protein